MFGNVMKEIKMTVKEFIKKLRHRIWSKEEKLLLSTSRGSMCIKLPYEFKGECRKVTENNVTDCLMLEDKNYVEAYRDMLKHGDYGLYGYLNGDMVFREWAKLSGYLKCSKKHTIFFGGDKAFIHYVYCKPIARGNGFQTNATNKLIQDLKGKIFFATVKQDNYISLRNFYKSGLSIESLLIVKNRFGMRIREERILNEEQKHKLESSFLK